jgi:GT2 family glycosyltransferase
MRHAQENCGEEPLNQPSALADAPLVATIVLNWRNTRDTVRCVTAAAEADYPNQRIYLFDNGADAASRSKLSSLSSVATLLESPVNLGYTGGNNAAIRRALDDGANYVWLLNSDAIPGPSVLGALVASAEADPQVGIVSPLICDPACEPQYEFTGAVVDLTNCLIETTIDRETGRDMQARFRDRFVLVGTAMLVRRALIERIGLLDDRLFAYYEDMDYSIRCLLAGFRNIINFETELYHRAKPRVREPHAYYYMNRNVILMWRKIAGRRGKCRAVADVTHRALRDLERFGKDHPRQAQAVLAGLWDGMLERTGQYEPTRRMPRPVEKVLRAWPTLFRKILDHI